jgi:hypothetical protein
MRKNLDGDDSCDLSEEGCELVDDDDELDDLDEQHQLATFAVFDDESNTPTPLQELQQLQQHQPQQYRGPPLSPFARAQPQHHQFQSSSVAIPPPPQPHLLTTAGRRHREVEMDLIRLLYKDDADNSAVNELMHLWMYETHDVVAAKQLQDMEEHCSPGLVQEMQLLQNMIQQYPTWAEPKSRLAALLYFKGQTMESYHKCLETLALKPWHFECMHLLVLLSLRMQDFGLALYWARQGLPPMRYRPKKGPLGMDEGERTLAPGQVPGQIAPGIAAADLEPICTKRRTVWVERALKMAADQWQQAELDTARALKKKRGRKRIETTTSTMHSTSASLDSSPSTEGSWE